MSMDIHGGWVLRKSPFIWAYLKYSTVFILRTAISSFEVEQEDTHVWSAFLLFLCVLLGSKPLPSPSIQKTRHRCQLWFLIRKRHLE